LYIKSVKEPVEVFKKKGILVEHRPGIVARPVALLAIVSEARGVGGAALNNG
jgi:hypothetical protein